MLMAIHVIVFPLPDTKSGAVLSRVTLDDMSSLEPFDDYMEAL